MEDRHSPGKTKLEASSIGMFRNDLHRNAEHLIEASRQLATWTTFEGAKGQEGELGPPGDDGKLRRTYVCVQGAGWEMRDDSLNEKGSIP